MYLKERWTHINIWSVSRMCPLTFLRSVVCLHPQAYSNKFSIAALMAIQFHAVLCLSVQRKGMVTDMKKYVIVLLVMLLLAGCSEKQSESNEDTRRESAVVNSVAQEEKEMQLTPAPVNPVLATECFSQVYGISKKWQDGLYVINGKDASGNEICGIVDENGNVELFEGYTALYPLADGNLIATTDNEVSQDCNFEGREIEVSKAGIPGIIINQTGEIVYQPSSDNGFERWYPINTHQILAVNVQVGFEETTLKARVIDQTGNMLSECSYNFQYWKDYIEISEDGKSWNLLQGIKDAGSPGYIKRGKSDEKGENEIFITYLSNFSSDFVNYLVFDEQGCLAGGQGTSGITDVIFPPKLYDSKTLLYGGSKGLDDSGQAICDDWEVLPIQRIYYDQYPTFDQLNARQEELSSPFDYIEYMGNITGEDESIPYFLEHVYIDPNNSSETKLTVYNGADGSAVSFPENYLAKMKRYKILGDEIFLQLKGEQGTTFAALFNKDGSIAKEAFLLEVEPDNKSSVARCGDLLAYGGDNRLVIMNIETDERILDLTVGDEDGEIISVEFNGGGILLRYREYGTHDTDEEVYLMFDLKSNQIA